MCMHALVFVCVSVCESEKRGVLAGWLALSVCTCKKNLKLNAGVKKQQHNTKPSVYPASSCVSAWEKVTREGSVCKSLLISPPLLPLGFPPSLSIQQHDRWITQRLNGILKTAIALT